MTVTLTIGRRKVEIGSADGYRPGDLVKITLPNRPDRTRYGLVRVVDDGIDIVVDERPRRVRRAEAARHRHA